MKTCTKCDETKPFEEFHKHNHAKCGYRPWCKRCHNAGVKKNQKANAEKYKALNAKNKRNEHIKHPYRRKNIDLKRYYGVTLAQYNVLFSSQSGYCAICKTHQSLLAKSLNIDHDHSSKEIRGLLCANCNFGLGQFRDSPELLLEAASYIRRSRIKIVKDIK